MVFKVVIRFNSFRNVGSLELILTAKEIIWTATGIYNNQHVFK